MAKGRSTRSADTAPPDAADSKSFEKWLGQRPRNWSAVIAYRSALRVLPLISSYRGRRDISLWAFRAVAIARLVAKYPKSEISSEAFARAAHELAISASAAAARQLAFRAEGAMLAAAQAVSARDAKAAAATVSLSVSHAGGDASRILDEVNRDVRHLVRTELSAQELANFPLWHVVPPPNIGLSWGHLTDDLNKSGPHWGVWFSWYENAYIGRASGRSYDEAFTDLLDELPWDAGAEAVNTEIGRRLANIATRQRRDDFGKLSRGDRLAKLAEVASPQPLLNSDGKLDAIPNQPFDIPVVDHDLSTLPVRQLNLIKIILSDLPKNAPLHLRASLQSYEQELKARGVQPILPLLKDDADIIVAAVQAPRAKDEWLEPGQRKAFDRFDENHELFVKHFPLDAEREEVYAQTGFDETKASGKDLVEPFVEVVKATQDAHKEGKVTDDFMNVVSKMTELARVLSTQPVTTPSGTKIAPEIRIGPGDRIDPITTKKRFVFGSLGFFASTTGIIAGVGRIATLDYSLLASRLRDAIEALSRFVH